MTQEKKPEAITRRDFVKGIAVGAVAAAAVSAGVAAATWPPAVAPPGVVTKTETVTRTTTAAATTVTAPAVTTTVTAPAVTTTVTAPAVTTTVTTIPVAPTPPPYTKTVSLDVNGKTYKLEAESRLTLLQALRDKLGLTGTKYMCDYAGECGACTVLIDGKPVLSCLVLAADAEGKKILTIEGLATGEKLHPIQEAYIESDGLQCGYCTPGYILTTKALLDANPNPTADQVKEALSSNICRCAGNTNIIASIMGAAKKLRGG